MCCANPVDYAFHFTPVSRIFTQRIGIIGTEDGGDIPFGILLYALRFNDVGITQTHFFAHHQTLVLLVRFFAEICAIDPDLTAKRHFTAAHLRFIRMVRHGNHFALTLRVVFDNQFYRIDYRHCARRVFVQIFANAGFQRRHLNGVVLLGDADAFAELPNGGRGIAATAQTGNSRHTRIVPAFDVFVGHQQIQLTLGHHGVFQIQAREFVLARVNRNGDVVQHPVVQTTVILELQRTQRMSNAFQRIADAMSKVVHRIDAPLVASLMMLGEFNAIQHRIAHHDKRRRHVDFSAQTGFTLFKTAGTHFFK
ncbi:Uncharacterised protein [Salmonella enterica subsp. enterica serovar Bovismorbificans]|uniref:Uncharacterized protein n=1 Tax=Salmonella enterica subsp. enterica serovar Bovismorbificans TaxID=58097 RepID=A0A655BT65_SALET|nr:Uncharacterised protein [Salmonella enterica subsp. enterica serovar Bovismorbificans]CNT76692.1 Uncharacterised protein [Salmonella enterica subsp. enterica serovar Bovismorbificans]CNT91701.1 Uncharacterised protein [Salmonella enterica subsp. enterica serovar Bovismorbificans]CNV03907.1 Uncharacterised protein [Salmonella enterica subsp. enterica serovar Bovismorbificans]CPR62822.1 Uncharacterised protein [Salmonella enterica subsp. enterica serovar Bovismorbificans]